MKNLYLIVLCVLSTCGLKANPWELDQETRDLFHFQINAVHQKHVDQAIAEEKEVYLIDFEKRILNFYDKTCSYCQDRKKPSQFTFEQNLNEFNFTKQWPEEPKAHCWGVTLFFIEQLLSSPEFITYSCADLLSKISSSSDFEEKAHSFSMNQHPYYTLQGLEGPLELNKQAMQQYFQILLEKSPSDYLFLPLSAENAMIDQISIYATLKSLPNKLIIIGYCNGNIQSPESVGNHCIVISTHPDKLFVFDSNLGIYHFPDLETLSHDSGKVLKNHRFRWLAAFPIGKDG